MHTDCYYTPLQINTYIQVCLPGLHITLGVYLRLFTLLEDECHALDVEMTLFSSPQSGDSLNLLRLERGKGFCWMRGRNWKER